MELYAFYINSAVCSGCKTCQIACRDKNNLQSGVNWRRVYNIEGGEWESYDGIFTSYPFSYFLSISCMVCNNLSCVKACPTGAFHVNKKGLTLVDHNLCMGCRYCEWACPYGAPRYDSSVGMMTKCNFCEDYIETGRNPSCVDACPLRALDFGPASEIESRYGQCRDVYPLPHSDLTQPESVINPHKNSGRSITEPVEFNEGEGI